LAFCTWGTWGVLEANGLCSLDGSRAHKAAVAMLPTPLARGKYSSPFQRGAWGWRAVYFGLALGVGVLAVHFGVALGVGELEEIWVLRHQESGQIMVRQR
jgi:hypothetical protein